MQQIFPSPFARPALQGDGAGPAGVGTRARARTRGSSEHGKQRRPRAPAPWPTQPQGSRGFRWLGPGAVTEVGAVGSHLQSSTGWEAPGVPSKRLHFPSAAGTGRAALPPPGRAPARCGRPPNSGPSPRPPQRGLPHRRDGRRAPRETSVPTTKGLVGVTGGVAGRSLPETRRGRREQSAS